MFRTTISHVSDNGVSGSPGCRGHRGKCTADEPAARCATCQFSRRAGEECRERWLSDRVSLQAWRRCVDAQWCVRALWREISKVGRASLLLGTITK
jgi:hypothetical protein